jgi:acylphosphatase
MNKSLDVRVYGRVQGVFFRLAAKEKALELGLAGLVQNEADGSVSLEVEGEETALTKFIEWCRHGSEYAWVKRLDVSAGETRGLHDFIIR